MTSSDNDNLTQIFFGACDLDGEERDRYLDEACGDNTALREQVERLLSTGDQLESADQTHLAARVVRGAAEGFVHANEQMPEQIGQYRILREIGEGGMSVVYEAEQSEPVKRRVALKVIRPGMDTRDVISRFEAERQALALMDHVNIAKIFDGGTTDAGRPYFVMELVEGELITNFCDDARLTIHQRLELFLTVCAAIQHAHQKGVVHRDLKPSNILVCEQDNKPLVKVIDFGIAKALDATLSDDPTETRYGQIMGTPSHMSPEQATGQIYSIDTRTDVYSLGVVLFSLLSGVLPYEIDMSTGETIRSAIEKASTTRPSVKLQQLANDDTNIDALAAARSTKPDRLLKTLRTDIDWIVLRAMELEQDRRYQTINALANDIRNYLTSRPIEARPPSNSYLLSRFVRRHRKSVLAVSVAVLALLGGAAMATIGMVRATNAEKIARTEQLTAQKAKEFLVDIFKVADPETARGERISASELLKQGAERIETQLSDEPLIQSELLQTMGRAFENLALYDEALPMLRKGLQQSIEVYGEQHEKVALARQELGEVLWRTGQYDEAKAMHQAAIDFFEHEHGKEYPGVAINQSKLGMAHLHAGEYEDAKKLFEHSLAVFKRLGLEDSDDYADTLNNLGGMELRQGSLDSAATYFRDALKIWRDNYGDPHPNIALMLANLGTVFAKQGDHDAAADYYQQALAMRRLLYNDQPHSQIAVSLNNLGLLYWRQNRPAQAEPLIRESLNMRRQIYGDFSTSVATGLNNLALVLMEQGQVGKATETFRESIEVREVLQGEDHPSVAVTRTNLAAALCADGDYQDGLREIKRSLISLQAALGPEHWRVASAQSVKGMALAGLGDYAEAEPLLLSSFEEIRKARGNTDRYTKLALQRIIDFYRELGRAAELAKFEKMREEIDPGTSER